jgi:hypothetical protein
MHKKLILVATVLLLSGCATPSFELPGVGITPPPLQSAVLEISYSETGSGKVGMESPDYEIYTLECNSDGTAVGSHPNPREACDHLSQNRMLYQKSIDPEPMACTMIYGGPQLADIEGIINGRDFSISLDRRDGCAIAKWDSWVPVIPVYSKDFVLERYPGTSFVAP